MTDTYTKPINAEPGKQGFQSALDQQQSLELMAAWAGAGWKDVFAHEFIREHFGKDVHPRTIANLKKRLRPRYEGANASIGLIHILSELPPGDPFWSKSCNSGRNDHHKTCTDLIEELQRITELLKHKHGVK